MFNEEYILNIVILTIFVFVLIRATWHYIFIPMRKKEIKRGRTLNLYHYIIMGILSLGFISIGFFIFYLGGYWKALPFLILMICYSLIIKTGKI